MRLHNLLYNYIFSCIICQQFFMIFHKILLTIIFYCDNIRNKESEESLMIGKTLQLLLDEKGINVNELASIIDVSNQTLYSIIKRDNTKIDIQVLIKICEALNVSPEYFYKEYYNDKDVLILTDHEKQLVRAYRQHPEHHISIDTLLNIQVQSTENKKRA